MSPDLGLFLWILGVFLFVGLPMIRSTVSMPGGFEWEEVPESALTPAQKEFFAAHDRKLAALGYIPLCFYRVPNLSSPNIARLYQSASGSGIAFAATMTWTKAGANALPISYLEFVQDFTDGTRVSTRNAPVSTVFSHGPQDILQQCPALREPEELKSRHDERVQRMSLTPVNTGDKELIFKRAQENSRRFREYQVSRGLLRYDPVSRCYRATYLTGLIGIWNFLNPLADNFTISRLIIAVGVGIGLPAAGAAYGLPPMGLLACYVAAGAVIGLLFSCKAFIWALILACAASRLWPPAGLAPLSLNLAMAFAADMGSRLKRLRERLI